MVAASFLFVVDVAVNSAYQIYLQSLLNPREYRLDALSFWWAIVDAYYCLYRKSLPSATLFTGSHSLHHPENSLQFDGINHWIAKGSQQWCSLPRCKGTSVYYSKVEQSVKCTQGRKKKAIYKKLIFYFPFSLSVHNSSNRTQNLKRSKKNISYKNNRWNIKLYSLFHNISFSTIIFDPF